MFDKELFYVAVTQLFRKFEEIEIHAAKYSESSKKILTFMKKKCRNDDLRNAKCLYKLWQDPLVKEEVKKRLQANMNLINEVEVGEQPLFNDESEINVNREVNDLPDVGSSEPSGIQEYKDRIIGLEAVQTELRLKFEAKEHEYLTIKNIENELHKEVEALKNEIQKGMEISSKLSSKLKSCFGVNEENKQKLGQNENNIKTLESQIMHLEAKNNDLEVKATELQATNADMSVIDQNKTIIISELKKQIEVLTTSLAATEMRKPEMNETMVCRDKCIEEQQGLMNGLRNKLSEITENNAEIQNELNDFKRGSENKDKELAKLSGEFILVTNKLNEKCLELDHSNQCLSKNMEESKLLSVKNSVLTKKVEAHSNSVYNLTANITSLEDRHESDTKIIDHFNKEMEALKSRMEILSKDNKVLTENFNDTLSALESSNEEKQIHVNEIKELRQEMEDLQQLIYTKNGELGNIQKVNSDIQLKLETSVQNAVDVQEKLSKLEVKYGDLQLERKCKQCGQNQPSPPKQLKRPRLDEENVGSCDIGKSSDNTMQTSSGSMAANSESRTRTRNKAREQRANQQERERLAGLKFGWVMFTKNSYPVPAFIHPDGEAQHVTLKGETADKKHLFFKYFENFEHQLKNQKYCNALQNLNSRLGTEYH